MRASSSSDTSRSLVEQNLRAELHLLYYETGEVVVAYFVACKVVATGKLIAQTQCIHHGDDAVEACRPLFGEVRVELRIGADALCDGCRFADAAGFYHDGRTGAAQ